MDWSSVVSVAITGAVGIVGVAGAIVSARIASNSATKDLRLSIAAENERANKAEKRRLYAKCVAAFSNVLALAVEYTLLRSSAEEAEAKDAEVSYRKSRDEMRAFVSEARLIAPEKIDDLLRKNRDEFILLPKEEQYLEEWRDKINALGKDLFRAMRDDLDKSSV